MKKKWIGAGISLLVALCVIFALIAGSYHAVFGHRFETAERKVQNLGDFPRDGDKAAAVSGQGRWGHGAHLFCSFFISIIHFCHKMFKIYCFFSCFHIK